MLIVLLYIYIYIAIIEVSPSFLNSTPEDATNIFNSASNVLSGQIALPVVSTKIEKMTYNFISQYTEGGPKVSKPEMTEELATSLLTTMDKIINSIFLQENKLEKEAGANTTRKEELKVKGVEYIYIMNNFTNYLLGDLAAGTELPPKIGKGFSLRGGKLTPSNLLGKTLGTAKQGTMIILPTIQLPNTTENDLLTYKHLIYTKNPRLHISNKTKGNIQQFNLYKDNSTEELNVENLTQPISITFELFGLSEEQIASVNCSFYNKSLNDYSGQGMQLISKTVQKNGKIIIKCSSSHLSEFAVATDLYADGSGDAVGLVTNNNLQTMGEMDKITDLDPENSIRNYIYMHIYIYSV